MTAASALAWLRRRPLVAVEVTIALGLGAFLFYWDNLRSLWFTSLEALAAGTRSSIALFAVDRAGTAHVLASNVVRVTLVLAPLVRLFVKAPGHHRVWIPALMIPMTLSMGFMLASISTPLMWGLLAAAGVLGWLAAGRAWLRPAAFVPALLCGQALLDHGPPLDLRYSKERLFERCAKNDGERPIGLTPARTNTKYYALTPLRPDLMILTGEQQSNWLRRQPDGRYAFEQPSRLAGHLWTGAAHGDSIWFTRFPRIFRIDRPIGGEEEVTATTLSVPEPAPGARFESDFNDVIYDAEEDDVYVTELLTGGIDRYRRRDGSTRRTQIGGFNIQAARRSDGMFVGVNSAELIVYDPARDEVLERAPSGFTVTGMSLCSPSGALAVADMAGRARVFELGPEHRYAFSRGVDLLAPRRLEFSPDCAYLLVTSADDRTVTLLRAADMTVVRSWSVGPALRDPIWVSNETAAVVDACSVDFLSTRDVR